MNEELARAVSLVIGAIAMAVGRHVGANQPQLTILEARVGFGDGRFPVADRLDLGAGQDDARLDRLENVKIVEGAPVAGDDAVATATVVSGDGVRGRSLGCHSRTIGSARESVKPAQEVPYSIRHGHRSTTIRWGTR